MYRLISWLPIRPQPEGRRTGPCPQAFAEDWMKHLANGRARKPNCLSAAQRCEFWVCSERSLVFHQAGERLGDRAPALLPPGWGLIGNISWKHISAYW